MSRRWVGNKQTTSRDNRVRTQVVHSARNSQYDTPEFTTAEAHERSSPTQTNSPQVLSHCRRSGGGMPVSAGNTPITQDGWMFSSRVVPGPVTKIDTCLEATKSTYPMSIHRNDFFLASGHHVPQAGRNKPYTYRHRVTKWFYMMEGSALETRTTPERPKRVYFWLLCSIGQTHTQVHGRSVGSHSCKEWCTLSPVYCANLS